jgi:hypothetical protein
MDREELRKGRAAVEIWERSRAAGDWKIGRQTRVSQLFI